MSTLKPMSLQVAKTKAFAAFWTFPTILLSSFMIGWGAEVAQYFMSRGLALAILAWLQTLPEFAVEAVIAWHQDIHLMLANLTGSLRLLVGLGWPMIFFARAFFAGMKNKKNRFSPIELESEDAIGVMSLMLPLLYFVFIFFKGSLAFYDGVVLLLLYLVYLWFVQKIPAEEVEEVTDMPWVPRKIIGFPPFFRNFAILFLFIGGGVLLYICVEPFLQSMMGLAMTLGISEFVFIQWLAPFLSEFPEKLTAFNWARREGKAGMALMNMVSSNINQWTLLVAMMLFIFCGSKGDLAGFKFDGHQSTELALTLAQSFLAFFILLDMSFRWFEALILLVLWGVQFIFPHIREEMVWVYLAFCAGYLLLFVFQKRKLKAFNEFKNCYSRFFLKAKT